MPGIWMPAIELVPLRRRLETAHGLAGRCFGYRSVRDDLEANAGTFVDSLVTVGLDLTQPTAEVRFSSTFGCRLDTEIEPEEAISYAFAFASVANAADRLGAAPRCPHCDKIA